MSENPKKPGVHTCLDADLGMMLKEQFDQGFEEVEVVHPTEGRIIVTREDYTKLLARLNRQRNMNPAELHMERKKFERVKKQKQTRFRQDMKTAEVRVVDFENDQDFVDVHGEPVNIDGMTFVRVQDYIDGIEAKEGEVGCFVDEKEKRSPIRIVGLQQFESAQPEVANNTGK